MVTGKLPALSCEALVPLANCDACSLAPCPLCFLLQSLSLGYPHRFQGHWIPSIAAFLLLWWPLTQVRRNPLFRQLMGSFGSHSCLWKEIYRSGGWYTRKSMISFNKHILSKLKVNTSHCAFKSNVPLRHKNMLRTSTYLPQLFFKAPLMQWSAKHKFVFHRFHIILFSLVCLRKSCHKSPVLYNSAFSFFVF